MRWFVLVVTWLVAATPHHANGQVTFDNSNIGMVAACINDAILRNSTFKSGEFIGFTCSGGVAQTLFDGLRQYANEDDMRMSDNSSARRRIAGEAVGNSSTRNNACYNRYQSAAGRSMNSFQCSFYIYLASFAN